jgi:hypothetical protein
MNDEPLIRLRPRTSKHGPNENPRKYTYVLRSIPRFVQMSKRGKRRAADLAQAEVAGRSEPLISAWPSGSVTRRIRIQVSGRPTEDAWPTGARRRREGLRRQDSMLPSRT